MNARAFLPWAALAALLVGLAAPAGAQNRRTVLTIAGLPLAVASTSPNDFDAGSVSIGSNSFEVDLTTNAGGAFPTRVTTVNVRCAVGCPAAVANLQWRRNDLGTWNTLTTAYALIESRTATIDGVNDPWSNSLFWRYELSWLGDPPAATETFNLEFQLVVTAP